MGFLPYNTPWTPADAQLYLVSAMFLTTREARTAPDCVATNEPSATALEVFTDSGYPQDLEN